MMHSYLKDTLLAWLQSRDESARFQICAGSTFVFDKQIIIIILIISFVLENIVTKCSRLTHRFKIMQ